MFTGFIASSITVLISLKVTPFVDGTLLTKLVYDVRKISNCDDKVRIIIYGPNIFFPSKFY